MLFKLLIEISIIFSRGIAHNLLSGSDDYKVNFLNGTNLFKSLPASGEILSIDTYLNKTLAVIGTKKNEVIVWNLTNSCYSSRKEKFEVNSVLIINTSHFLAGCNGYINYINLSNLTDSEIVSNKNFGIIKDTKFVSPTEILIASMSHKILVYSIHEKRIIHTKITSNEVWSLDVYSRDIIVAQCGDKILCHLRLNVNNNLEDIKNVTINTLIKAIKLVNEHLVVLGSDDQNLKIWSLDKNQIKEFNSNSKILFSFEIYDSNIFLAGTHDGIIQKWNRTTIAYLNDFVTKHNGKINALKNLDIIKSFILSTSKQDDTEYLGSLALNVQAKPPKSTKAPKKTKSPNDTKGPKKTKSPNDTKGPKKTKSPNDTKGPKKTKSPNDTKGPKKTKSPNDTKGPKKTKSPNDTKGPKKTKSPNDTKGPKKTKSPNDTKGPKKTKSPNDTKGPKKTKSPNDTKGPKKTKSPNDTKGPKKTKSPNDTKGPKKTKSPNDTKGPKKTKSPNDTKDPKKTKSVDNTLKTTQSLIIDSFKSYSSTGATPYSLKTKLNSNLSTNLISFGLSESALITNYSTDNQLSNEVPSNNLVLSTSNYPFSFRYSDYISNDKNKKNQFRHFFINDLSFDIILSLLTNNSIDLNNCLSNCSGNGFCNFYDDDDFKFICECFTNFFGPSCHINKNIPCLCKNNATCINNSCECPSEKNQTSPFYGKFCEFKIDVCENETCSNNGVCFDDGLKAKCKCFDKYSGEKCQIELDEMKILKIVIRTSSIISILIIILFYLLFIICDLSSYFCRKSIVTKRQKDRKQKLIYMNKHRYINF
ncbi:unnamed protein product [Brachionus calyciflorus]|uniref:EGF-like domain-containing protein n=1 Tax=Brachionus calyciflorus TaxID=104777 RepID=A0A813R6I4_9BILA|nr:unnamed protein product [Brachionus calyciflorus]